MKSTQLPSVSPDPREAASEPRSAFNEIVSEIVATTLKKNGADIRDRLEKLHVGEQESFEKLHDTTRRLARNVGEPGVRQGATLFDRLGDPRNPEHGTLSGLLEDVAGNLDELSHAIDSLGDAEVVQSQQLTKVIHSSQEQVRTSGEALAVARRIEEQHRELRAAIAEARNSQQAALNGLSAAIDSLSDAEVVQSQQLTEVIHSSQEQVRTSGEALAVATRIEEQHRELRAEIAEARNSQADLKTHMAVLGDLSRHSARPLTARMNLLTALVFLQTLGLAASLLWC